MVSLRTLFLPLLALLTLFVAHAEEAHAEEEGVNIYSYRKAYLLEPVLEAFTKETGIPTSVVYAKSGLISRLKSEGKNSPADLIVAPSFDVLKQAISHKVTQEFPKSIVPENLPKWLYDEKNLQWISLSIRSRVIFASRDRVKAGSVSSYDDLADPKFKGKVCLRTGLHPYNLSLFSEYYALNGYEATRDFLSQLKNNLARRPQGNDRDQLRAISNGTCDLALVNSYYYLIMNDGSDEQRAVVEKIYPITPKALPLETHVNISGAVLAKWAPHKENALKLIAFMLRPKAQKLYVSLNKEWPVIIPEDADFRELFKNQGLAYKKEQTPDWETMYGQKQHVVSILKDINFNE
jgi:iron(III) transport system substrate-binding protein